MPISDWTVDTSKFSWIDIVNPTTAELKQVSEKYSLHHYTLRDCLEPDHLPKHEDMGDTQFIITRMLNETQTVKLHTVQEISSKIAVFYNDSFIITIHRLPQSVLEHIKVKYVATGKCKNTSELVTKIIWFVLHSYDQPAIQLSNEVDTYEDKIFLQALTPLMMEDLYFIKRKAAICNKLLMLTGEVINTIRTTPEDIVALQDVKDLHVKLSTLYDQANEDVTNLLNIYLSLSARKTNEVVKVLTIFSVFFMPLTFVVGIYGMNFDFMPELNQKWGYPAVLILLVLISAGIFWWFRRKKWL
ncbi:MAG: magnesium transporter CorA [Ferruginibacter sp.]|nr:magnesium transporter CorA [Ferruginibacter sp.]